MCDQQDGLVYILPLWVLVTTGKLGDENNPGS